MQIASGGPKTMAEGVHLQHVFMNLMRNAIEATQHGAANLL